MRQRERALMAMVAVGAASFVGAREAYAQTFDYAGPVPGDDAVAEESATDAPIASFADEAPAPAAPPVVAPRVEVTVRMPPPPTSPWRLSAPCRTMRPPW